MDALPETTKGNNGSGPPPAAALPRRRLAAPAARPRPPVLAPWVRAQSINVVRHAAALRPFDPDEFGDNAAAPSAGHIQAVNALMTRLRDELLRHAREVVAASRAALADPAPARLEALLRHKEHSHTWVQAIERVWDFYFELFGQRQSRFGDWLLSCDRIALDCYQAAYLGLGKPKSIPAPPPFAYMRTGFSPATFRRAIPLRRLGRELNPFPLVQLPYHRLVNPWTLGAILHEVSHNLQNELGLASDVPRAIGQRLLNEGLPLGVARVWVRWNREAFADLSGLLLGGPAVVASLMDVLGRGPATVFAYSPGAVHPVPYLRTLISIELLRRMGFPAEAEGYGRAWRHLYGHPEPGDLPDALLRSAPVAIAGFVDAVCYQPFAELGNKRLSEVLQFSPKEDAMLQEAAGRLANGVDPGVVPARYLIGAARVALDRRLASPTVITENFYRALARR